MSAAVNGSVSKKRKVVAEMPSEGDSWPESSGHRAAPCFTPLTANQHKTLAKLDSQFQLIRDRVTSVVQGYKTGLILTGRGGIGKSHTVMSELERLDAKCVLHNSHVTPRSLFDAFETSPSSIHLIEDAEEVLRNGESLGLLRSATWGTRRNRDGRIERSITWRAHRNSCNVVFDGGIIVVGNRRLGDFPELKALTTRVPHVELLVADAEIAAHMHRVAREGYQIGTSRLDPADCVEVVEFILTECKRSSRPLDMRMLTNALADRLQAEEHDSGCTWHDLVASTLNDRPSIVDPVVSVGVRQKKQARELEIAREICDLPSAERLAAWKERTGGSQATLYRRLADLGSEDALD